MAVTKVTTKVIADDAVTIDKINDSALVTEAEGISSNDNDTTVPTSAAVKDYVDTEVAGLVDSAPATLDTLNELAAALGDDANFSTTITNSIATKQDASTALTTSTTFGGDVSGTYNNIVIADDSHNHVISNVDGLQTALDAKVDGTGTAGTLPKLSDSNTITDSAISESGEIIDIDTTGAIRVPDGTTAQRPSTPVAGMFRYNTTDGQFEGYTTEWGAIAGSGGAGASATLDIEQDSFNGDGSTVAFTLTSSADSENNLQVYVDGVYQSKDNFSVSGTTLTFTTAPNTGTGNIEVMHLKSIFGAVRVDSFTGDGSDVTFDLTHSINTENNTQVYVDGVYQSKDNYSTSGTTITFSTAPPNGSAIEVVHIVPSSSGGGGVSWQTTAKTAAFTAVAGEGYFVNTTSAAITVTLPSSPSAGDEVTIVDYAGTADTNNITITSSDNINGSTNDVKIHYERGGVSMVYVDATQGWIAYNATNETATALGSPLSSSFAVDYLVVAGGGAGGSGYYGAGGGAGGLRTSYTNSSSLSGHTESQLTLSRNTNYSLTIGAGGATGGTAAGSRSGNSGINTTFSTITSTGGGGAGGGGGQGDSTTTDKSGKDGGSGGGAAGGSTSAGNAVTSPAVQGYNGGTSGGAGAGGGGASAAGNNATSSASGIGGAGLAVNIISATNAATALTGEVSGSDVYFAGGGGGGGYGSTPTVAAGGIGGGGDGDERFSGTPNPGSPNTGGGGGGAGNNTETGGIGGSGVVILRYPSGYTIIAESGIIEASGSPFTEGSDKVSVFTGGTGNISFS